MALVRPSLPFAAPLQVPISPEERAAFAPRFDRATGQPENDDARLVEKVIINLETVFFIIRLTVFFDFFRGKNHFCM